MLNIFGKNDNLNLRLKLGVDNKIQMQFSPVCKFLATKAHIKPSLSSLQPYKMFSRERLAG